MGALCGSHLRASAPTLFRTVSGSLCRRPSRVLLLPCTHVASGWSGAPPGSIASRKAHPRRFVAGTGRWIATTALAWLLGLGVFLGFASPLWQEGQPMALTVTIGVAGGLLMAATTSAITGLALRRLLR